MGHGGGHLEPGVDPMYWLMPAGLGLGLLVVVMFECFSGGWHVSQRKSLFRAVTKKDAGVALDSSIEEMLNCWVDGISNIFHFWTGGALHLNDFRKEHFSKAYEMLGLVGALLLAIGVTFYMEVGSEECHLYGFDLCHTFGLVCCVANCALWMATLSSAFFAVVINACDSDEQLSQLVGLYGNYLMRVPMMLFAWGAVLLFLEFVLFFKLNVDPGLNCSACLGACFVIAPLFFHCLHKMGWVAALVHKEAEVEMRNATTPSPEDIQTDLRTYVASKGGNCMALDREEFLDRLKKPRVQVTSVQRTFAGQIFDAYVEAELKKFMNSAVCFDNGEDAKAKLEDIIISATYPEMHEICKLGADGKYEI